MRCSSYCVYDTTSKECTTSFVVHVARYFLPALGLPLGRGVVHAPGRLSPVRLRLGLSGSFALVRGERRHRHAPSRLLEHRRRSTRRHRRSVHRHRSVASARRASVRRCGHRLLARGVPLRPAPGVRLGHDYRVRGQTGGSSVALPELDVFLAEDARVAAPVAHAVAARVSVDAVLFSKCRAPLERVERAEVEEVEENPGRLPDDPYDRRCYRQTRHDGARLGAVELARGW